MGTHSTSPAYAANDRPRPPTPPTTAYNARDRLRGHDRLLDLRPRTLLITAYVSADRLVRRLHCGRRCPHAIAERIKPPVSVSSRHSALNTAHTWPSANA